MEALLEQYYMCPAWIALLINCIHFHYLRWHFLCQVHKIYRSTGASFQKAQAEFAQGVMKNEAVQHAAADAAANAARGAVQGQYGSNNRY